MRARVVIAVEQGFHRYSTDARWHVPHFEKMLYDNAQLAVTYAHALTLSEGAADEQAAAASYRHTLKHLLEYVHDNLTHKVRA